MEKFNDPLFRQRLRQAKTAQELYLAAVSESAS